MVRSFLDWFCLEGRGYQFWSGIGSGSPVLAFVAMYLKHHNCHVKRCWRPGHIRPRSSVVTCHKHRER